MTLLLLLRLAYLGAAALILLVAAIPPLRVRFLAYGARTHSSPRDIPSQRAEGEKTALPTLLFDRLAALTVPHAWFASFYAVSVASSLFWATQILTHGPLFRAVARASARPDNVDTTMTIPQITVTWLFLFAQGTRRLYESLVLTPPSHARMWVGHWVLGVLFYIGTAVAVWVEGISAVQHHAFHPSDLSLLAPTPRTFLSTLLFFFASGVQHDSHAYLASLRRRSPKSPTTRSSSSSGSGGGGRGGGTYYKLPTHPAFTYLIAPHYTAECLIYLSLALVAAPPGGCGINGTLACVVVFVFVNLGVTAAGTKRWYEGVFGEEAVRRRWRLVPFVF